MIAEEEKEYTEEYTEAAQLTSYMNFRMIEAVIKCLKDQQSRELRRIRTTCPPVFILYTIMYVNTAMGK